MEVFLKSILPELIKVAGLCLAAFFAFRARKLQRRWEKTEDFYGKLLSALNELEISLKDRLEYYLEPNTEYLDLSITVDEGFKNLAGAGSEAMKRIRELMGHASIYLSTTSHKEINKLISAHWNASQDAINQQEFLKNALSATTNSFQLIRKAALKELSLQGFVKDRAKDLL